MKSRILSLLVALAVVLSLAVPAFAQTGETTENNNLPDVTDVTDEAETDEDLPEETEEDEDDPAEPSGSEDNNNIPQNNIVNVVSGSAGGAEGNGQEEEPGSEDDDNVDEDNTKVGDNGNSEEDDSDEELNSEDGEFGENTSSEDGENETEEENESGEDGESEEDGNETEEDDEAGEGNSSEDDENASEEDAESENGESMNSENSSEEDAFAEDEPEEDDKPEEGEDEPVEDANEPEEENESEESEDNSADDESTEDADIVDGFRLLTAEELEGIDLEDAEVLQVNSVVFMAAGAVKTEPLMAAAKSAPVQSGTCGDNLTWELDDEGVLTISGTGNMYEDLLGDDNPWRTIRGNVTGLNIGDGVTSIGKYAFNWFDNPALNSVFIPASVISIGDYAFFSANYITTFQFGHSADSDLTIGTGAFQYNLGHNEASHLVNTTVKVPDANNINPAISGYDWKGSLRSVTFKSAPGGGSGNSSGTGPADSDDDPETNTFGNNGAVANNENLTQPVNYNYSSPLEMIENWEKRNTFYDIVLESVLKNKTDKDENYNLHNVAESLYRAADIDNAYDILATAIDKNGNNGISTRELKKQDELMLKLLKENFSMYLADERLIEQQCQEAKIKEILSAVATTGGMAQLGFNNAIHISQTASGILQIAFGQIEIACDTITDAYYICVMQANYDRAMDYLDRLQSSVDPNTSLYRACDMMREDLDSNWQLGFTNRQLQKDKVKEYKLVGKVLADAAITFEYQLGSATWAYAEGIAKEVGLNVSNVTTNIVKLRAAAGDICGALLGWNMGSLVGKILTKSTGDMLKDEEDLLRLYIASTEIKQALQNTDDEGAIYDLSSLYLTAREAGLETSCKYFVDAGYAREETDAIIDTVHNLRHSNPALFVLDGVFSTVKKLAASQEPKAEGPYPEEQEFYNMLYTEGCKLDEIRDAMGLPTYERNPQKPDKVGRIIEKAHGAIVISQTLYTAYQYDEQYYNTLNSVEIKNPKVVDEADINKIRGWEEENRPTPEQYSKYKSIYDNPRYFDQTTGAIKYAPNDGAVAGTTEIIILQPGTRISRYGSEGGFFVSPEGTPFEQRSLPAWRANEEPTVYEVTEPIKVKASTILPFYDQEGMGTQYELPETIEVLRMAEMLKVVE